MPDIKEVTTGVFVEQQQQGANQFLPNSSVTYNMLAPDVQAAILNISNIDIGALTNIDWSLGNTFFNQINISKSYTFSNLVNGKIIVVAIKNTSGSTITVTFPAGYKKNLDFSGSVLASYENVYTIIRSNNTTYITSALDMI